MKDRQRWQPEEDALLRAYVKQYGAKEWNLISQRMGKPLDRDPKSCLERWKNYLKPGIKKGSLTPEEQSLVISLQAKYGNKWKKIAAEVPGRTAKRLGKWWEVFKEKQLKQLQKSHRRAHTDPPAVSAVSGGTSPENAAQGKYDHILETFAEKYVQPKLLGFHHQAALPLPNIIPATISIPDPGGGCGSGSGIPPWMSTTPTGTSSLTSSSTPSPSVSLTLSPSEPVVVDLESNAQTRVFPIQQVGTLVHYCKELEESRQSWVQHKKEATWRLNRLEQQLESEKARKKREKMEEIETRIRRLREEEMSVMGLIESEYREQLKTLQRDSEAKESRLMEAFGYQHVKLAKLVRDIGIHQGHGLSYRFALEPN